MFKGTENYTIYTKDAFHRHIIQGEDGAVNPKKKGTKVAPYYVVSVPAGGECTLRCRLMAEDEITMPPFSKKNFDDVLQRRRAEADQFYSIAIPGEGLFSAEFSELRFRKKIRRITVHKTSTELHGHGDKR